MATTKDWIIQSRTHTAALTIAGTLLAVRLSAPGTTWQTYLAFAALAWLMHCVGFMVNGALDLDPWDRADPAKQHHPLVAGRIRERDLWAAIVAGTAGFSILGSYLAHANPWSLLALFGFAAFGTLYNHQAKVSLLGPIWISLSFACIPLYAWLAVGPPTTTLILIVAYSFLLMMVQICLGGWTKELSFLSEINLLRSLGASASPTLDAGVFTYRFPMPIKVSAAILRGAMILIALLIARPFGVTTWLVIVCGLLAYFSLSLVVSSGLHKRSTKVLQMSLSEVFAYWTLVAAASTYLPFSIDLAFLLGPFAYFVAMNRYFWKTWVAPAV